VAIPILNNGLKEINKAFRVTLSNAVGASLGSTKTTTVTIVDDDQGFQFESASYTVGEDAGAALVCVLRGTDDTSSSVTVDYVATDVTATNGLDYVASNGTLSFAPGDRVKVVPIPILNNGFMQATRSIGLTLNNPTGGAVLGPRANTTVSIRDNDPGVGFELSSCSVWRGAGEISLRVVRGHDGDLGPITVDYATDDGTAQAGRDYQASSGTLEFQTNDTMKSLTVPILPTAVVRLGTFRVTLANPTGGATLGTATNTVTIQRNEYTVDPPFDSGLAIRREYGVNILTWTGGGQLQRADRVTGPWQTLATAQSPWNVQPPIPASFYRVTSPRPVNLYVPSSHDGKTPIPLVIALHGYSLDGTWIENNFMHLQPLAESRGFLYCHPDGTKDQWGNRFWNATDAVGDFGNTGVDDAGYLRALIEQIAQRFAVDRKRIFLIGHSNGGFMAYRMACQSAELIAGIASFAGMTFLDPSRCQPVQPVNILHICGTADELMYSGGADAIGMFGGLIRANTPQFPGAIQTIQLWAGYNGASGPVTDPVPTLDLTTDRPGLDTAVTRYTNAPLGGAVELWTIKDGTHIPALSSQFSPQVVDWLLAHPKP
jgi:polyhydroxybutyrate depolymerase